MQRTLSRLATVLVLLVAFTGTTLLAQSADTTVYVTKTGAKYHKAGCRSLSRSQIPMTLADASKRYAPCSICKPPILAAAPALAPPATASSPRAAPVTKAVESGRCQAETKKGTQCSRKAKPGSQYCWQHGG
jgi:hypothetical protein